MSDSDAVARQDAAARQDPVALAIADRYLGQMQAAVGADDYATVSDAARDGWYEILTCRGQDARVLLESIPAGELRDHPVLLMMLGLIYNAHHLRRARALRFFATAVVEARRKADDQLPPLDRAIIRTAESAALRLLGRPALGVGAARAAVRLVDQLSTSERASARNVSRIYTHAGTTLFYAGHTAEAIDAFAKGIAEAPDSAPVEGFGSMAMLAGIHVRDGELDEARMLVEVARDDPAFSRDREGYAGTMYRVAEAALALESFDVAAARHQLAHAAPKRRVNEHWLMVAETEALTALVDGQAAEGLASLEAAANIRGAEGRSSRTRQQLARIRGLLQLALGDLDAAAAIAYRDAPPGAVAHIERARVALATGQAGSALKELKAITGITLPPRKTAEAAALEVAVIARFSHAPRIDALSKRLGALLTRTGLRLPLALVPPEDLGRVREQLSRAGYHGLAQAVARSLLLDAEPAAALTKREYMVLAKLPERATVSELAHALGVSPNTVKTQLRSLYRKLDVTTREDAIAVALDRHLLSQTGPDAS